MAKTRFASATDAVRVYRGGSRSALFVSAVGMPAEEAATQVAAMNGAYRIPTLLKQVDAIARKANREDVSIPSSSASLRK